MNNENNFEFLDVLSPPDREQYMRLRTEFCNNINETNVISAFDDVLSAIKTYSIRNNEDDGKRCDCCGVCWLPDKIGVNTNRLSFLTGQKKNNINSALLSLMYIPTAFTNELYNKIPGLENNISEKRMWTIRKLKVSTPTPALKTKFITNARPAKFNSPNPHLYVQSTVFSHNWSYEDFRIDDTSQGNEADFFEDSFALPLNDWYNDSINQF